MNNTVEKVNSVGFLFVLVSIMDICVVFGDSFTLGYLTGSQRRAGNVEYSMPGRYRAFNLDIKNDSRVVRKISVLTYWLICTHENLKKDKHSRIGSRKAFELYKKLANFRKQHNIIRECQVITAMNRSRMIQLVHTYRVRQFMALLTKKKGFFYSMYLTLRDKLGSTIEQ